ncbi:unnamed protein product [Oppiella nova]|uniref:Dephospho-CoA kinase n=1 Tax=Oppiella nova TaxID=334625 RepID=A0A7R9LGK5_9ACAR|nr:unnamed protein product [Oppiella nova]CAG2163462.1 unnamed protein product [Oppiella nova]
MFIVGLTGGIASGKSTVSKMLTEMGVDVIDADVVARDVVRPGMKALKLIRKHFGADVILESGEMDRKRVGEIIFNDHSKRQLLNNLPLLYESGKMKRYISQTIVVKCSREQQIQRLKERNNFTEEECVARIDAQMSLDEKCRMSDFVIDNSQDITHTKEQVDSQHVANSRSMSVT